jgi:hypothetical protein
VIASRTALSTPSCSASKRESHCSIALLSSSEAFSTTWVCSCRCLCDWLVRTFAKATDAEEHKTKGLDTEALVLVPMVLGKVPDAVESDAELQAQCHD